MGLPSGNLLQFANWKMAIEILDLHSYKMVIFHTHVSFPEGFNKFAAFQSIGRSLMIGQQFTGVICMAPPYRVDQLHIGNAENLGVNFPMIFINMNGGVKGERINTIRGFSFLVYLVDRSGVQQQWVRSI